MPRRSHHALPARRTGSGSSVGELGQSLEQFLRVARRACEHGKAETSARTHLVQLCLAERGGVLARVAVIDRKERLVGNAAKRIDLRRRIFHLSTY